MKKTIFTATILTCVMSLSSAVSAATIGKLSWDGSSDFITVDNSSKRYLQLGLLAHLTYAETVLELATNATYDGFHIASQTDAYQFYNFMAPASSQAVDIIGAQNIGRTVASYEDGALGDNLTEFGDVAWFLSDEIREVGLLQWNSTNNMIFILDNFNTIEVADTFSTLGESSWLVVSDAVPVSNVPIPAAAFMFAPALLSFLGLRCKKRAALVS